MTVSTHIYLHRDLIQEMVKDLGHRITVDYELRGDQKPITLIGILNGCQPFLADLSREIHLPHQITYVTAKSYTGNRKVRKPSIVWVNPSTFVHNQYVLVVDTICDTGKTLEALFLEIQRAASVQSCCLLNRAQSPENPELVNKLSPSYFGHCIYGRKFLVGYGLDYYERYRNLPDIYQLTETTIC